MAGRRGGQGGLVAAFRFAVPPSSQPTNDADTDVQAMPRLRSSSNATARIWRARSRCCCSVSDATEAVV